MPKFRVVGADRETGEDIELTIEAKTPDEARSKANRRGMLVADCTPAAVAALPAGDQRPSDAPAGPLAEGRPRPTPVLVRLTAVAVVTIIVIVAAVYFAWLRPQNQRINQTLADAVAQSESTEAMSRQATQRQIEDVQAKRRQAAGEDRGQPPEPSAQSSVAEMQANAGLLRYVQSAEPFVREMKGLRARVRAGASYSEFRDKLQAVIDEFAQVGDAPRDANAVAFAAAASRAIEQYQRAESQWAFAIRNNLLPAEKYKIREMIEGADAEVGRVETSLAAMKRGPAAEQPKEAVETMEQTAVHGGDVPQGATNRLSAVSPEDRWVGQWQGGNVLMRVRRTTGGFEMDEPKTGFRSTGFRVRTDALLFRWSNFDQVMALQADGNNKTTLTCFPNTAVASFEQGEVPAVEPHWKVDVERTKP